MRLSVLACVALAATVAAEAPPREAQATAARFIGTSTYLGRHRRGWPTTHAFVGSGGLVETDAETGRVVRFRCGLKAARASSLPADRVRRAGLDWLARHDISLTGWRLESQREAELWHGARGLRFVWRRPPQGDLVPPALTRLDVDYRGRVVELIRLDRRVTERPRCPREEAELAAARRLGLDPAELRPATCHRLYDEADRPLFRWRVTTSDGRLVVLVAGSTGEVIDASPTGEPARLEGPALPNALRTAAAGFARVDIVLGEPDQAGRWGAPPDSPVSPTAWRVGGLGPTAERSLAALRASIRRGALSGSQTVSLASPPQAYLRFHGADPEVVWCARFFGTTLEFCSVDGWPVDPLGDAAIPSRQLLQTVTIAPNLAEALFATIAAEPLRSLSSHRPTARRRDAGRWWGLAGPVALLAACLLFRRWRKGG